MLMKMWFVLNFTKINFRLDVMRIKTKLREGKRRYVCKVIVEKELKYINNANYFKHLQQEQPTYYDLVSVIVIFTCLLFIKRYFNK